MAQAREQRVIDEVRGLARELGSGQQQPIGARTHLTREAGLDSLARAELLLRLERRFGIRLPERLLAEAETVGDLVAAVEAAPAPQAFGRAARPLELPALEQAPTQASSLVQALEWHCASHPQRPHAVLYGEQDQEEQLCYAALYASARRVAGALVGRGLRPRQTVALMLPTGKLYLTAFLGVMLAGAIPVPIYPPTRIAQLEEHVRRQAAILANAQAVFLITFPQAKWMSSILRARVESLREVLVAADLEGSEALMHTVIADSGDVAMIQYTSGSTGQPKGVMLSHANLLANIRAMGEVTRANSSDVYVSWLPLYHDMGLIASWLASLYHGMPIVLMSPLTFLARPALWLWAIHRHGGTVSGAPNFAYEICAGKLPDDALEGLDLSRWRIAYNGAEPVSVKTLERFRARFAPYGFKPEAMMPVYGLAECTVCLTCPPPDVGPKIDRIERMPFLMEGKAQPAAADDDTAVTFVACGYPLPHHRLRIVDAHGRECAERQQGRLEFQGPSATAGYFNNPVQTRQLIRLGWWDTGDLAYVAEGRLYLTGRVKDILIRAGRNVHPQEIEQAVGDIAGIRKGCVVAFGSPDPRAGTERLVVLAETRETAADRLAALRHQVIEQCVDIVGMPPDDVVLAPPHTVLKTSSGKIRRSACKERYERGQPGAARAKPWRQWLDMILWALLGRARRGLGHAWRGIYVGYAWLVFALLAIVTWIGIQVLGSPTARWSLARAMTRLALRACAMPFSLTTESPRTEHGGLILVANHASYLDGLLLVATWPAPIHFVAKAELRQSWALRRMLTRLGCQFVTRAAAGQSVEDAQRLRQFAGPDRSLLFFPEGTLRRAPGLLPFHMGAFMVAVEAKRPVVPVALIGTRQALPEGSWAPRPGVLEVRVGGALAIPSTATPWEAAVGLRQGARDWIARQCGEPMVFE